MLVHTNTASNIMLPIIWPTLICLNVFQAVIITYTLNTILIVVPECKSLHHSSSTSVSPGSLLQCMSFPPTQHGWLFLLN